MKKIFVLSALIIMPLVSCGKKPAGGKSYNPFNAKYEITKQRASTLVENWMTSLSKTAVYKAHLSYSSISTGDEYSDKHYVVDYSGPFEEKTNSDGRYDAYYNLTLVPHSLVPEESNVSESEVWSSSSSGKGLSIAKNYYTEEDKSYKYKFYYYSDDKFCIYGTYRVSDYSGYTIMIMDKNGLVSYAEDYEKEGARTWKCIRTATFTKMVE